MTLFRNTVGTAALNNWVSPISSQIAFGRGSLGSISQSVHSRTEKNVIVFQDPQDSWRSTTETVTGVQRSHLHWPLDIIAMSLAVLSNQGSAAVFRTLQIHPPLYLVLTPNSFLDSR